MIHGTGSFPAAVALPATEGFSAVRFVWMLSDGTCAPSARSWPDGSHWRGVLPVAQGHTARRAWTVPAAGRQHDVPGLE
jgi:hypothetical protein